MEKMKKIIEIVVMPLVLILGYVLAAMIFFVLAGAAAVYLGWVIEVNIDGPHGLAMILDLVTLIGTLFILRSRRLADGVKEIWKQLSKNP